MTYAQCLADARDLKAAMEVLGGPDGAEAIAYRWILPQARGGRLSDYRVRVVIDDPICPVVPEVKDVLQNAVDALAKAGTKVEEGWPEGVNPQEQLELYLQLLVASIPPQPARALGSWRLAMLVVFCGKRVQTLPRL